jgi:H+/Cl- antiporter ClcA
MLLPALVGSATSYLAFVAVNGTTPLFPIVGNPSFDFPDLAGAALLGVAAGIAARLLRSCSGAPRAPPLAGIPPSELAAPA